MSEEKELPEVPVEEKVEEKAEEKKPAPEIKEAVLPVVEEKERVGDKEGIKETKDVLNLGFAFANSFKLAMENGSIDALDIPHLVAIFPALTPALEGVGKVPAELKDLSEEEIGELLRHAAVKLGDHLEDPKLVRKVEKSLKVGLAILDLVKEF